MNQIFFRLIQVALGQRCQLGIQPTEAEWTELFELSNKHTLTGVCYAGLERLPHDERPARALVGQWFMAAGNIANQNATADKRVVFAVRTFAKHGFASCLLKGQGIARLYPNASMRQSGDIDLWVDGPIDDIIAYVQEITPRQKACYHHIDFPVFKDVPVEVHYRAGYFTQPIYNRRWQRWCEQQKQQQFAHRIPIRDEEIAVPTVAFNLVYQMQHLQHHLLFEGVGLRQLVDYFYLLMHFDGDKSLVMKQLRYFGLARMTAAMMFVLAEVTGLPADRMLCHPNRKWGEFVLDEIMRAGNFGKFDDRLGNRIGESQTETFWKRTRHSFLFLRFAPGEVLCDIPFRLYHWYWRRRHKSS